MEYELTLHARKRMEERLISSALIDAALLRPTRMSTGKQGVILFKKIYARPGQSRLIIIAGKFFGKKFKIFTVIDTSKVRKYL